MGTKKSEILSSLYLKSIECSNDNEIEWKTRKTTIPGKFFDDFWQNWIFLRYQYSGWIFSMFLGPISPKNQSVDIS